MNDFDGQRLKISSGNSKMGPVPNLSLPPVLTCRENAPCIDRCYAKKYYSWPNVREAWGGNYDLYKNDPAGFMQQLAGWFVINNTRRFRFFVGGDFPDEYFFLETMSLAERFDDVSFLAFTKRYGYADKYIDRIPNNFNVVLSMWPGLEIPDIARKMPTAWLSCDDRFQHFFKGSSYIKCCSNCGECGYSCWGKASVDLPVMFDLHR